VWWLENDILAVHHHLRLAHGELVVPCVKEGENCFEDEDDWKDIMEEHGVKDQDRQELVHDARDKELMQATVEGRVFVVALDANRAKSAEQARPSGEALLLLWCAQRSTAEKILPDGMVSPETRTAEHLQLILGCWLEHGELGIVARRTDRTEQNPPWMDGHHGPIECKHSIRWKAGKAGRSDGARV
jgi:hypothetical protein